MNRIDDCAGQARAVDAFLRAHGARFERLTDAPAQGAAVH
jgi:hypothetical protein